MLCACNQPTAALPSPTPSSVSSAEQLLTPNNLVSLGPRGVGDIGCDGQMVGWTTSSGSISKTTARNDVIEVASETDRQPKVVATATHGGTLTDAVRMSGAWLVFLEYRQNGQSGSADFWYLNAVDVSSGRLVELASATSGLGLKGLPWYDAAAGKAVWNEPDASGGEMLRVHDFNTGVTAQLPVPQAMFPVEPSVSSSDVVFVDNSTDPARGREDFLGRRGSLVRLDLKSGKVSILSADPSAWMPLLRGGKVVWVKMPASTPPVVATVSVSGGGVTTFGSNPVTPQTNGQTVVWYDSHTTAFMKFDLSTNRTLRFQIAGWEDPRSVFALCGNRLFFAVPPAADGGTSTIRYVDL